MKIYVYYPPCVIFRIPEKWSPGKKIPGKMVPGKKNPRKNGPRKIGPGKLRNINIVTSRILEKWSLKNGSRKIGPQKNGPGKIRNKKSCGKRRASWCVCVEFWDVIKLWKVKTRQQTQNSETKIREVNVKDLFFVGVVESIVKNKKVVQIS